MDPSETGTSGRDRQEKSAPERRSDPRLRSPLSASTLTIDPVRDRATNEPCFQASEDDQVVNVSRRGVCLLSSQPPNVGTRLWLQIRLPDSPRALEVIGRACWTRVQFERGEQGARPICAVGVEVLGGSPAALDRYDRFVTELNAQELGSLAAPAALG